VRTVQNFMGMQMQSSAVCPQCSGRGKIIKNPCSTCRGKGKVRRTKKIKVQIPAGIDDGSRLRLAGKGGGGLRGGQNGDLYVHLSVRPSEIFEREGLDLFVDVPVSPVLAALGGSVVVPTPSGEAQIKIPEGTPNGKVFRLRGKGVASFRGGAPGDLDARIVFEVPSRLSKKQRAALEEFQKLSTDATYPDAQRFSEKTKIFYAHKAKLSK
jgi:molecular chaperone DnaJ